MRSYIAIWALTPILAFATPTEKASSSKSKTATRTTTAHKASKPASTSSKSRRHHTAKRAARPSYQTHPTSERYKEIQQALADKGYFKGDVNGEWGADSVDALKRFQTERQIPDDGKISSLALIDLGLGPKHNGGVLNPTPTPPAAAAPHAPEPPPAGSVPATAGVSSTPQAN